MRRRDFITLLGGATMAWPLAAGGQQRERMRREAQQVPDPRIADLVQAGKIRVGMHSVMYTKDLETGALKAASTGIILLDVARTLAARMGVEVLPVGHPTIPEMLTCLTAGVCDVGFMGPDRSRAGVDFSPPILQLD